VAATHAQAGRDLTGLADVTRGQDVAQGQLSGAQRDQASAEAALVRDRTRVADARLTASVTGTDLSLVVLDAYWRAAVRLAALQPACRLSWPTLAGIGRVESGNGTFGGDEVGADGEEATPIIGIALDGTNGTQRITDTDGGALDHDTVYDRAVGPMQILPSAWRRYGLDGNGDGQRDPQNLYDAALTAGVMLCRYGPLDTDAGLSRTFFHYNPSNAYVAEVLGYTHAYQAFVVPPVG
jgi:membrane-bound lytic murein transglycosylase B